MGGSLSVENQGTINNTTVSSGGSVHLSSGGTANSTTVSSGGSLLVSNGGVAYDAVIRGVVSVFSSGYVFGGTVESGGYVTIFSSGSFPSAWVGSGGKVNLQSGACANSMTLTSGGSLHVGSGGQVYLTDWTPCVGKLEADSGAIVNHKGYTGVYFGSGDVLLSNTSVMTGKTVSGTMYVMSGGLASRTAVASGASMDVWAFGTANSTTVNGGFMYVRQSGAANSTAVNGGLMGIDDTGVANNTTVNGGLMYVYSSGSAVDTAVASGGGLLVFSGGSVTGSLQIASGAAVTAYEGSTVQFDLTSRTTASPALVTGLSLLRGAPDFTIRVASDQTGGTYRLADDADGFDRPITVWRQRPWMSDEELGVLSVGETLTVGEDEYTLNLTAGSLTLTVGGEPEPGPEPISGGTAGDLNADGRADIVMTISQGGHPADGSTGAWLIQADQTAAWGDLSTRNPGWEIFGTGRAVAGKNTDDVFIKSSDNIVGAWTTASDGRVSGWETIGEFSAETQIVGLGDFNGNGLTDLLLRNTNGAVGCFFTAGEKTGWNYFQSLGDEWKLAAVGDLNGDGRSDIALKHDAGFAGKSEAKRS